MHVNTFVKLDDNAYAMCKIYTKHRFQFLIRAPEAPGHETSRNWLQRNATEITIRYASMNHILALKITNDIFIRGSAGFESVSIFFSSLRERKLMCCCGGGGGGGGGGRGMLLEEEFTEFVLAAIATDSAR